MQQSGVELTCCQLNDINQHLLCALCSGYLVNATAVIECLHTFCRSCIIRYLESSQTCPVCDVPLHENNPLLGIKADLTLQRLVYKLVPGVFKEELERRFAFYKCQPAGEKIIPKEVLLKDVKDSSYKIYSGGEKFSVCLQYIPSSGIDSDKDKIETRYLLCPSSLSVGHLKKLICNKLDLSARISDSYQLDILHANELLDDGYTLMDVAYITDWGGTTPLQLDYTLRSGKRISCVIGRTITSHPLKSSRKCYKRILSTVAKPRSVKSEPMKKKLPIVAHCEKNYGNQFKKALSSVVHTTMHKEQNSGLQAKHIRANKLDERLTSESDTKCAISGTCTNSKEKGYKSVPISVLSNSCPRIKVRKRRYVQKLATDVEVRRKLNSFHGLTGGNLPVVLKQCIAKQQLNCQKSVFSKLKISKTTKPRKVYISNLSVSKVNALKYLFLPKFNLWKDRSPLNGLMRKHSKWRQYQGKVLTTAVEDNEIMKIADCAALVTGSTEDTGTTEKIITEIKDVVSSSSKYDSFTTSNDNVVSSSTSSSQYDDDYDNVTSANGQTSDNLNCGTIMKLHHRSVLPTSDELAQTDCRTSGTGDEDKKTLCVPIRLGEHGELLLRLPQNVSVECSFRPVAVAHVAPELESNSLVNESVLASKNSSELFQCSVALSKSSAQVDETCVQSGVGDKPTSATPTVSSLSDTVSGVTATVSKSIFRHTSNNDETTWTSEQPDISLFPFVTVSPSCRKATLLSCSPRTLNVSTAGLTSPVPIVSSSLGSPIDISKPDKSSSADILLSSSVVQASLCQTATVHSSCVAKVPGDDLQPAMTRREIIKVPVYTAVLRDYKTDTKSANTPSNGLLDLTVSEVVKQRETGKHVKRPLRQPVPSEVKGSTFCASLGHVEENVPSLCVSLRRCDAVIRQQQQPTTNSLVPPTTKRLKLTCNGITIYRTLNDTSKESTRSGKHRSSRSKSFERPSPGVSRAKHRHRSVPDEYSVQSAANTLSASTNEVNCKTGVDGVSHETDNSVNLDFDEPLELTTQRVRERYKASEYECCGTALDLTVGTVASGQ